MRILINPDLLHPERDANLMRSSKLVRVATNENPRAFNTHTSFHPPTTMKAWEKTEDKKYLPLNPKSYSAPTIIEPPKPSFKSIEKYKFRKANDVVVYNWATTNYYYFTISVVLEEEPSTYSISYDRLVFHIDYDVDANYWVLKSELVKKGYTDTRENIAEVYCESPEMLVRSIKRTLLFLSINPQQVLDLFVGVMNEDLVCSYDETAKIILVRTPNYKAMETKIKDKPKYSGYNHSYSSDKKDDKKDDKDDWKHYGVYS